MTQNKEVLSYILEFGSITDLDAVNDLGCLRLGSRICDLRNKYGVVIATHYITKRNKYGKKVSFGKYEIPVNCRDKAKIVLSELN